MQAYATQIADDFPLSSSVPANLFLLLILLFGALLLIPFPAYAAADPLSVTLCVVVNWFTGGLGRAIATLGIIVLGIGAVMGKVSWEFAIIVASGVAIMFGAGRIVALLTDNPIAENLCAGVTNPGGAGMLETVLCNLADMVNSAAGRAIGTLAIIILGISSLLGKLPVGMSIVLGAGIGALYGADDLGETLVNAVGGAWMGCTPGVA